MFVYYLFYLNINDCFKWLNSNGRVSMYLLVVKKIGHFINYCNFYFTWSNKRGKASWNDAPWATWYRTARKKLSKPLWWSRASRQTAPRHTHANMSLVVLNSKDMKAKSFCNNPTCHANVVPLSREFPWSLVACLWCLDSLVLLSCLIQNLLCREIV